ncbi:type II toxin-antitoxin system PemK/MazF family toxin [Desulfosudis oleivorans]|uniref:type II toxin-antitoxin system PemK/MazF family toxin n=1 Tax=Desulfosudis oleivorans TaxID=181663 RepID=UPI0009FCE44D
MAESRNDRAHYHEGRLWWVSLDPTQGSGIKKTRPCVVLSHNTINRFRRTVVVVPLSTAAKSHPPITVPVNCQGELPWPWWIRFGRLQNTGSKRKLSRYLWQSLTRSARQSLQSLRSDNVLRKEVAPSETTMD